MAASIIEFFRKKSNKIDINKDILLMVSVGKVYFWDGSKVRKAGGSGLTNCLAEYKNEIFEGAFGGVNKFSRLDDEYVDIVAERGPVVAMCSHKGSLFDASNNSLDGKNHEIRETLTNKLIARKKMNIHDLESYKGKLYDCGLYGIYETFTGKKVSDGYPEVLCSYNGALYGVDGRGIYDVFSGKIITDSVEPMMTRGLCSYNYRLVDAEQHIGVRDTLKNEIILTFDQFAKARYPRGPIRGLSDMISVNGLAFKAAIDGEDDAFKAIEREYRNQLSPKSVIFMNKNINRVKTKVVNFLEPGTKLHPEQSIFMPNLLAEFVYDPQLGMIHGQGSGHAFIKTKALKEVTRKHRDITNYDLLVKKFFKEGYHVKRVDYIHFDSE